MRGIKNAGREEIVTSHILMHVKIVFWKMLAVFEDCWVAKKRKSWASNAFGSFCTKSRSRDTGEYS